ncbi:MAG: hypothetical protein RIT43_58 [Bacteroidota bacterium]
MLKILKITGNLLSLLLDWLLLILIFFAFAIRTSTVQTYLAQRAAAYLSKELNTTVKIGKVAIVFIDRVALDDVLILDQNKDTLAGIKTLFATVSEIDLNANNIHLDRISIEKGTIHLNRDKISGDYNYEFLEDYFSSGKKTRKSKPVNLFVDNLSLDQIDFKYDDFRKSYSSVGMDYDHLDLRNIRLEAGGFSVQDNTFAFEVKALSTRDKCGFVLNDLSMNVIIDPQGLKIANLKIQTPRSNIHLPKFHLLLEEMDDFSFFEDSVRFDSEIAKSKVSLKDVSYFAPALEGMDAEISIEGKVEEYIKNLHISKLDLRTGKSIVIRGDLILPDFRNWETASLNEHITYANVPLRELSAITLPVSSTSKTLNLGPEANEFGTIKVYDLKLKGIPTRLSVFADTIKSDLGSVGLSSGMELQQLDGMYAFQTLDSISGVQLNAVSLYKLTGLSDFGLAEGNIALKGFVSDNGKFNLNQISGFVKRFDLIGYPYSNIQIKNGSFVNNVFEGEMDVKDDNLDLTYKGKLDLNGDRHLQFSVDLTKAFLDKLQLSDKAGTKLSSNFSVDIFGVTPNKMRGNVTLDGLVYVEGEKEIRIPSLSLHVERGKEDIFRLQSKVADATLKGKINFETLIGDFTDQFSKVFPSIQSQEKDKKKPGKQKKKTIKSHFTYEVISKDLSEVLEIFVPELQIPEKSVLQGHYDGELSNFTLSFDSPEVIYDSIHFRKIKLDQNLTITGISAEYTVSELALSDSIVFHKVRFLANGTQENLLSELTWDKNTEDDSRISWETHIPNTSEINFELLPSYFSINQQKWEIEKESHLKIANDEFHITKLKIQRADQYISVDGKISRNDSDKLNFQMNDIDLRDISELLGSEVSMKGRLNGWGYIANPYTNLTYMGDASIREFYLNEREVGDIYLQSDWNKQRESIRLGGDLTYRGAQTFKFDGNYYLEKETDNLDFDLVFDQTDLQFTNAFMDPDVIKNIRGVVDGRLSVKGTPEFPKLKGEVNLLAGNAKVELLGVNFGLNGKIKADEYGFYIDNMPVLDEEGNSGSLIGSIYHSNFEDWNFDLQFDLDKNTAVYQSSFLSFVPDNTTMNKFLILNTKYKEGDYYFGKAYVTGKANIFGYADNLDISVDLKTQRGTSINFPMYGMSELEEENGYIQFLKKGENVEIIQPKIDFSGVNLDLNFTVTPDAKLRIIFNETTGDEISAAGSGDIDIKLDNLGDLSMEGTFRVKEGMYNFAMGPIRQPFYIQDGGTITWTGDPYNATIDLKTYYEVYANLTEIAPDQFQGSTANSTQKVQCYLGLTESLMKPAIGFDIKAPKADESGKALISRITGDKDELNRQFFSLMLWKRFQPLKGTTAAGGSAAMDLVSNQINSMLSQVSKDYKLNVNLDSDQLSGESTYEFGVTKGFLDNRLILNGSFGVENVTSSSQSQSALIGDVRLEYLLNESGTIRVNVFNESNDFSVIQEKNLGPFTQGAGIHYQEDFDNFGNFKLAQYFLDIFRKKENKRYPVKRNKRQTVITD